MNSHFLREKEIRNTTRNAMTDGDTEPTHYGNFVVRRATVRDGKCECGRRPKYTLRQIFAQMTVPTEKAPR